MGISGRTFGDSLGRYRKQIIIILTPLCFLPLPLCVPGQEAQVGYVLILMAVLWCSEALPLAVTALIPVFIFPMLGIMKTEDICALYMPESTMMFTGGLMVAIAIEHCNLHKRIALGILIIVGVQPIMLMLGFMFPTWFLSMWISNTATTGMMLPILEAVLEKFEDALKLEEEGRLGVEDDGARGHDNLAMTHMDENDHGRTNSHSNGAVANGRAASFLSNGVQANGTTPVGNLRYDEVDMATSGDEDMEPETPRKESKARRKMRKMCIGMTLGVAYSANVGGTGTLTGTTPNVVMKNQADEIWRMNGYLESPVNFSSWMVFGVPSALITLILIWLWLSILYLGPSGFNVCKKKAGKVNARDEAIKREIKKEYASLGSMRYDETLVLFFFITMILLWFFRSPGFITGWGDALSPETIKDAVVSMLIVVTLHCVPKAPIKCGSKKELGKVETLLNWQIINDRMPWSVIYLIGGGMALATACIESGLADLIGQQLAIFDVLPTWFMVFVISFIASWLTEITSNTAMATLLLPIVASLAENLRLNPLYLMFPVACATSYAFMLPVATPPNAIAFSYNRLKVVDMVIAGSLLKLTVFCLTLGTETWGMAYFDFDTYPFAINATNVNQTALMQMNQKLMLKGLD